MSRNSGKSPPQCGHCGKLWHTIENCYEIIGYPESKKGGNKPGKPKEKERQSSHKAAHVDVKPMGEDGLLSNFTPEQVAQLRDLLNCSVGASEISGVPSVNMVGKIPSNTSWIIDSGILEHITHEEGNIKSLTNRNTEIPVKIPHGDKVPVRNI